MPIPTAVIFDRVYFEIPIREGESALSFVVEGAGPWVIVGWREPRDPRSGGRHTVALTADQARRIATMLRTREAGSIDLGRHAVAVEMLGADDEASLILSKRGRVVWRFDAGGLGLEQAAVALQDAAQHAGLFVSEPRPNPTGGIERITVPPGFSCGPDERMRTVAYLCTYGEVGKVEILSVGREPPNDDGARIHLFVYDGETSANYLLSSMPRDPVAFAREVVEELVDRDPDPTLAEYDWQLTGPVGEDYCAPVRIVSLTQYDLPDYGGHEQTDLVAKGRVFGSYAEAAAFIASGEADAARVRRKYEVGVKLDIIAAGGGGPRLTLPSR
jgi:hypothetical protein